MSRFSLFDHQVPEPPFSHAWVDALRWMVCVMDPLDERLSFIAGVLSHCLKNDGSITPKQADACVRIFHRVVDDYRSGILVCQNTPAPVSTASGDQSEKVH